MDYEKAYKEALERAKYLKENTDSVGAKDISYNFEYIFPELRESEDERIRKALLESFKYQQRESYTDKEWLNGIKLSEIVSWLEKQGEQKPAWSEEDEKMLCRVIDSMKFYLADAISNENKEVERLVKEEIDWLKSLKTQLHWKPSEEQMMTLCALCVLHKESKVLESLYNDLKNL